MSLREDARGYQAIADDLREQIRTGVYSDGAFLPTERELQSHYRVSRSTVRRALSALADSGWAEVKPSRGVAARLGPTIERGANVAFIDHADAVNQHVFFAISHELQTHGMHLIHVDSRGRGMEGAVDYAADNGFAAAFVWSKSGFPDADRVKAAQRRMPILAVDHSMRGVSCDLVLQDNLGGSYQAVDHLIRHGRRNVAITGMMDMLEINHEKFSGYLKAIYANGMPAQPRNFVFCFTGGSDVPDMCLLEKRLIDLDRPDAVFVMQDMLVASVVETIFACGLRIPEDVAVVAYNDDFPLQIDDVSLTTVAVDWQSFAKAAVARLLRRLARPSEPYSQIVLPVSLVVRGSCGAPCSEWTPVFPSTEGHGSAIRRLHREYLQIRSDAGRRPASVTPAILTEVKQ